LSLSIVAITTLYSYQKTKSTIKEISTLTSNCIS